MAAIKWKNGYNAQQKHLKGIVDTHAKQGKDSVIIPFLKQQGIDLAAMVNLQTEAKAHEQLRHSKKSTAESLFGERNLIFQPIWKVVLRMVQYLKSLYGKNNVLLLSDWGVKVLVDGRVKHPTQFLYRVAAVKQLVNKHFEYTDVQNPSLLAAFITENNIDMHSILPAIQKAELIHTDAQQNLRESQHETQLRNKAWRPVMRDIRKIGNYLHSLYPNAPRNLGEWGIDIVLKSVKKANSVSTVPLGGRAKEKKGVKNGAYLKNLGDSTLIVESGGKIKRPARELQPNEEMSIKKGYSVVRVRCKDETKKGKFRIYER